MQRTFEACPGRQLDSLVGRERAHLAKHGIRFGLSILVSALFFHLQFVVGGFELLGAVLVLWMAWRVRDILYLSRALDAACDEARKLGKTAPDEVAEVFYRALAAADKREAEELAQLREWAPFDRRAAVELRDRLRAQIRVHQRLRQRKRRPPAAELSDGAYGPGASETICPDPRMTRQRLAEAEYFVEALTNIR